MAVGGQVRADATVGTVGSSTAGDGALDNDVVDDAVVDVELGSLSVGAEVDEELANSLEGLLGPATLGVLEGLGLGVAADTTGELSEGNNLLVFKTVLHVLDGSVDLHALGGTGHFVSVLEVGAEIANSALSRCKREKKRGEHESPISESEEKGATAGTRIHSLTTYT